MTKRNLFIAIGSTSTNAMIALIERLQDLGIYMPDREYKDMFVAIDTDHADNSPLERLKSYNKGDFDHTFSYHFSKSGEDNIPSHHFLKNSYHVEWNSQELRILESEHGVGGLRYKSYSTVEWKDMLGSRIDNFFQNLGDTDTLKECKVILIATAWGGTASGMFQNVSDFIASKLYEKCGRNKGKLTPFYTVLALPNLEAGKALSQNRYQGLENFAYFMRDIQQAGWRGSLSKETGPAFIFPEMCDLAFSGPSDKIPVETNMTRFNGTLSPLPQRAIIAVPTQSVGTTPVTIAEQLLVLAYLDVLAKNMTGTSNTADGKFVDLRAAHNFVDDCPVLIGINMVECQYPRGAVIKKIVEQNMIARWKKLYADQTSIDPYLPQFISDYLAVCVEIPEESVQLLESVKNRLETDWVSSNQWILDLKTEVDNFVTNSQNIQYIFPNFDNAKELLAGMVKYANKLNEEDPQKLAFESAVTLQDIRLAYAEYLDTWYIQAQEDVKQKHNKIIKMIDYTVGEYNRLNKGKGLNNFIVRYCNGNVQVIKTFLQIAREEIEIAMKDLQRLLLTRAIVRRWQLDEKNIVENDPNWRHVDDLFNKVNDQLLRAEKEGERNRFIKTVHNQTLEDTLASLVKIKTDSLVSLMETSDEVASLQGKYDKIRNDIQSSVNDKLKDFKDGGSYKMITLSGSSLTGCCPCFYPNSNSLSSSMFHFYVKSAGAGDITWDDVRTFGFNEYVTSCLNPQVCVGSSKIESSGIVSGGSFGTWVDNNLQYNDKALCGMWFGSVDIGMTFRNVLDAVYAGGNDVSTLDFIQDAAFKLENGLSGVNRRIMPQCRQTLFEKVVMGAIFGVINTKTKGIDQPDENKTLSISLKTPAGEVIWAKSSKVLSELGLLSSGTGIILQNISAEFIKTLMTWMNKENGTCRFAEAFSCKKLFLNLVNQERFVLTHLRLVPTKEQNDLLLELYKKLEDCIEVSYQ